jgi:hypothetical protein
MKRPIENNSSAGQAVYDPFVGSGTTIIAAEMTGRACHAIELSPAYIDVAVTRWQNFTGQTVTRETGETFAEAAEDRADSAISRQRLAEIEADPSAVIAGERLEKILNKAKASEGRKAPAR